MSSVLERSPVEAPPSAGDEKPYRFSVDEFYRMIDLEFFPREARVGLWDGQVYEKMAKTQAHAAASIDTGMALARVLPPGWSTSSENPFTISQDKAPLPDLIVLRGRGKDYLDRRPGAADVGLVIEFSLTSLKADTGPRLEGYARAGVVAYWVFNLRDSLIHAYSDPIPQEGRFASVATYGPGDSIPFHLDGVQVAMLLASDLLPTR